MVDAFLVSQVIVFGARRELYIPLGNYRVLIGSMNQTSRQQHRDTRCDTTMTQDNFSYDGMRLDFSADEFARLTLARPEKRNAIGSEMYASFQSALRELNRREARLCVLASEGPSFCAGADLKELGKGLPGALDMIRDMAQSDILWLAEVRGGVLGAAVAMVAACPFVFCDETAWFSLPEIKRGMFPASIADIVALGSNKRWAYSMALSARRVSAKEAMMNGLVTEVVPESLLAERSISFAHEIQAIWDKIILSMEDWRGSLRLSVAELLNAH